MQPGVQLVQSEAMVVSHRPRERRCAYLCGWLKVGALHTLVLSANPLEDTGAALLERDYESVTSHFSDAVWIIVNGRYVSDNTQWLDAICDAWQGSQPVGCV